MKATFGALDWALWPQLVSRTANGC
jgi:hypothetical protein